MFCEQDIVVGFPGVRWRGRVFPFGTFCALVLVVRYGGTCSLSRYSSVNEELVIVNENIVLR